MTPNFFFLGGGGGGGVFFEKPKALWGGGGGGGEDVIRKPHSPMGGEQVSFYIVIQSKSCTLPPLSQAIINEQSLKAFKQSS